MSNEEPRIVQVEFVLVKSFRGRSAADLLQECISRRAEGAMLVRIVRFFDHERGFSRHIELIGKCEADIGAIQTDMKRRPSQMLDPVRNLAVRLNQEYLEEKQKELGVRTHSVMCREIALGRTVWVVGADGLFHPLKANERYELIEYTRDAPVWLQLYRHGDISSSDLELVIGLR